MSEGGVASSALVSNKDDSQFTMTFSTIGWGLRQGVVKGGRKVRVWKGTEVSGCEWRKLGEVVREGGGRGL